jgi:hypothetical protein
MTGRLPESPDITQARQQIELPDKTIMNRDDYNALKNDNPEAFAILEKDGYRVYQEYIREKAGKELDAYFVSLNNISGVMIPLSAPNPEKYDEALVTVMLENGVPAQLMINAGVNLTTVNRAFEKLITKYETDVVTKLPSALREIYENGKESGDMTDYNTALSTYAKERQDLINLVQDDISEYYDEDTKGYNITKYLYDNKNSEKSVAVLTALGFDENDIATAKDAVNKQLQTEADNDDYINNFINNPKERKFNDQMVFDAHAIELAKKLGWDELGKQHGVAVAVGQGGSGRSIAINDKEFWESLNDDQKKELAQAIIDDPRRSSELASALENWRTQTAYGTEHTELGARVIGYIQSLVFTPVYMPVWTAEAVAGAAEPYTISNESIRKHIDANTDYFNKTKDITGAERDLLDKSIKDAGINISGDALTSYKALSNSDKEKVMSELTRNQYGINTSNWNNVKAGAMTVATIFTRIPVAKILGKSGTVIAHIPITGIFAYSLGETILDPKASLEDKIVAGAFLAAMGKVDSGHLVKRK